MATTTKTLTPTNQTITIPDMTERPNVSLLTDGIGKEADAINALNSNLARNQSALTGVAEGTATNVIYYNAYMVQIQFVSSGKTWTKGDIIGTIPSELRPPTNINATASSPTSEVLFAINSSTGTVAYGSDANMTGRISINVTYLR